MSPLDSLVLPQGYGLRMVDTFPLPGQDFLDALMDKLLIWEGPRRGHRYVVSVDVADGLGLDRTVADVMRVGTISEPAEQVAQFITDSIDPVSFAPYCDLIGHLYPDIDGYEALMAIECNGHGLSVQEELQRHYGYQNFFVWEYPDAADLNRRFSTRAGWWTNARTRAMMLSRLYAALKTYRTQEAPDLLVNSPHTLSEMQWFQTEGELWMAQAASGRHDDCVMTLAIGLQVAHTLSIDDIEPVAETRRRKAEERSRQDAQAAALKQTKDYWCTDVTADEMQESADAFVFGG